MARIASPVGTADSMSISSRYSTRRYKNLGMLPSELGDRDIPKAVIAKREHLGRKRRYATENIWRDLQRLDIIVEMYAILKSLPRTAILSRHLTQGPDTSGDRWVKITAT